MIGIPTIEYKIKVATAEQILLHLKECNENFVPFLDTRVNLEEYSKKIFDKAVTFEAWLDGAVVGLVAAYFNDFESLVGYITSVSINKDYFGKGVASRLIRDCITYANDNNFKEINLEVYKNNDQAISLYKRFGFVGCGVKNDLIMMKLKIGAQAQG